MTVWHNGGYLNINTSTQLRSLIQTRPDCMFITILYENMSIKTIGDAQFIYTHARALGNVTKQQDMQTVNTTDK